jgi:DNA replication initiation complex subunit (GINS family)
MVEETITFELIRKIQREEQGLSKLTKLPENFFFNISTYLDQKNRIAQARDDRKVALEIKNIERLVEDIYNRRERKISNTVLIAVRTGIPPENLTAEEQNHFDLLITLVKNRRKETLDTLLKNTNIAILTSPPAVAEEIPDTETGHVEEEPAEEIEEKKEIEKSEDVEIKQPTSPGYKEILFKEDTSEFVGADMKDYGPYRSGDMAVLPEANAALLVANNIAEEIN